MTNKELIKRAKQKAAKLKRLRADERYQKVIGALLHRDLLHTNFEVPAYTGKIYVEDAVWVGEQIEPRVLELLPAIALKKSSMFLTNDLGEELEAATARLKRGELDSEFLGVPLSKCYEWLPRVGHKGKYPRLGKFFRFDQRTLGLFENIKKQTKLSEAQIIRDAIELLAKRKKCGS